MANQKGIKRLSVILVVAMILSLVPATLGFAQEATVDRSKIEAFVGRLYTIALGRTAEADGLKYWADELEAGKKTAAQTIGFFVTASKEFKEKNYTNEQYVDILYKTFFDRAADAAGRKYWLDELAAGASRTYIVAAMLSAPTQEFQGMAKAAGIKIGNIVITDADKPMKVEAVATGAKTIKLGFSKAPSADVVVKFGFLPVDGKLTLAADKKSAEFKADFDLIAGDYTVEVGGHVLASLKVAAQTLSKVEITTNWLQPGSSDVNYKAYNQYGEEYTVAASEFTATAWNVTDGGALTVTPDTNKFVLSTLVKDKSVLINLFHNPSGKSHQVTIKVNASSGIAGVQLSAVSPLKDKVRITAGETGFILPVKLVDQFGKEMAIPTTLIDDKNVIFISSNTAVVNPSTFSVATIDGKNYVKFNVGASGAATITAIVPASASQSSVTVNVDNAAAFKSIVLQQPTGLVVSNEPKEILYQAVDTFGGKVTLENYNHNDTILWVTNNPAIVNPVDDLDVVEGKLIVTPKAGKSGVVTLSAYVGATLQGTITLDVKAEAYVAKIQAVDGIVRFGNAGVHTYSVDDFVFIDQYNRKVTDDSVLQLVEGDLAVALKANAANDIVTLSGKTATGTAKAGDTTFVATYQGKTLEFKVYALTDSAIVNYDVTKIDNTTLYKSTTAAYHKVVKVANGFDVNGNKVAVVGTFDAVINSNDAAVQVTVSGDQKTVTIEGIGANDSKATVQFWKSGKKVGEYNLTVSTATPVATTLSWKDDVAKTVAKDGTNNLGAKLVVKDQYGVDTAATGAWMTTDATIATVNSTGLVSGKAKGKATITFVATATGAHVALEVTVE